MYAKRFGTHELPLPTRATPGSAGFDLMANIEQEAGKDVVQMPPGARAMVPCGFGFAVPRGWVGRILPRSGHAFRNGIAVLGGVIDSDYRGEVAVLLLNTSDEPFDFRHGDRIAQLVVERILVSGITEVDEPSWVELSTDRGGGGFGHTGNT